jgi:predicted MarR family transcription regulator
MKSMSAETGDPCRLADAARMLRALAGLYDQAARTAASL